MLDNEQDSKGEAFLFFGPSGAGKGTQVELLKEYLQQHSDKEIAHLDMGAKLRSVVKGGQYAGRKIDSIISKGNFLPGTVPVYFMYDYLMEHFRPEMHLLADGVVRSAIQVQAFHEAMSFFEHENYKIIFIELSDESITKRLLARGRNDDTEEGIKQRIDLYKEQVYPLLDLFESFGKQIIHINGEPDIETVHNEIVNKINL